MINKNKMSGYARSMIFPEPNPQYGLNRRSVFNLIKFFRFASRLPDNHGLSGISYPERRFSLGGRSYSWYEYNRALDSLVDKEIEPFSWRFKWRSNDSYKALGLDSYSSICYNRKCKFMNPRNM